MAWISPTGFIDSGSVWTDEALAYDENTGTYAYASALKGDYTDNLELTHAALDCDKVQIWVSIGGANINAIEVDAYYSSAWHNTYSGAIVEGQFVEYAIGSTQSVTAMRVRFYSTKAVTAGCMVHEADFNEVAAGAQTYYQSLEATAVGVSLASKMSTFHKNLSAIAVALPVMNKGMFLTLDGTAIGVAVLSTAKMFSKALDAVALGIASLAKVATYQQIISATAIVVSALTKATTHYLTIAATSIGVPQLLKGMGKTLSAIAIGAPVLNTTLTASRTLGVVAQGVAGLTKQFIAGTGALIKGWWSK